MKQLLCAALIVAAWPAMAQNASPTPSAQDGEQIVLTRGLLEALRTNSAAQERTATALDALVSQLGRLETATRAVPPSVEGLRTDIVAIRTLVDRLAQGQGIKRPAATLRFGPFACGTEGEATCATNACKSVGYANGVVVTPVRTGTGSATRTSGIGEATCFD